MKRKVIMGAILFCGALFVSCAGDDVFPLGRKSTVSFQVDVDGCLVSVDDYDNVNTSVEENSRSQAYFWICTDYGGRDNVHVSLTFDNSSDGSQCLRLREEVIADGTCA